MADENNNEQDDPRDRRDNGSGRSEFTDEQDGPEGAQQDAAPEGAPEAAEASTDHSNSDADNGETDPGEDRLVSRLRREAASHRVRARELEQELTIERDRVAALQRAAVAKAAHLPDPSVLSRVGLDLGDLVAPDGTVDEARVMTELDSVRRSFGLPPAGVRPGAGGGGLNPSGESLGDDPLAAALTPKRRR